MAVSLDLTENGIHLKSFQELRSELKQDWIKALGGDDSDIEIDLSPTSPDGLHIDLECKTLASISQSIQAVVANLNRDTAAGFWLDILASYQQLTRKKATQSTISLKFTADMETTIPAGTQLSFPGVPAYYETNKAITADATGKEVTCTCVNVGAIEAPAGDNWKFVSSSIQGVSVLAEKPGSVGLEDETDAELRKRMNHYSGAGLATYKTMLSYMESMEGVETVNLHINDEDTPDLEGVPPHSFRFTITGTVSDSAIAEAIWHCKPTGIKPFGEKSGEISDSAGYKHTMYWTKPEASPLWIQITLTQYQEEKLPEDYQSRIKAALLKWAEQELIPGKDVIPQRFYGPVYSVDGISNVLVECTLSDTEPTSYNSEVIPIDSSHYASLSENHITIILSE